jgi:hypothetical protein
MPASLAAFHFFLNAIFLRVHCVESNDIYVCIPARSLEIEAPKFGRPYGAPVWDFVGTAKAHPDVGGLDPSCSLAIQKFDKLRDDLIRRFFHEPVAGITNDHAFDIRRNEPALLNKKIAGGFFTR